MLRLDEPTSTVVIDGRHFPAVGVVCPAHASEPDEPRYERLLGGERFMGGRFDDESTYVVAENGVLVHVRYVEGRLDTTIDATQCVERTDNTDDRQLWLPAPLMITGQRLEAMEGVPVQAWGPFSWRDCDEEWLGEFIPRLARFQVAAVDGPSVELVRLAEAFDLAEALRASRN